MEKFMKSDLNFLLSNLIAHRGYHSLNKSVTENSFPAFMLAIEKGYIIELDLHILKDGNVVVFHDDNLNRMTGVDKNIKDTVYSDIKNLRLQNTNNYIPLFKDVLDLINGRVPIIVEFKYDVKVGLLEKAAMDILKDYNGEFVVKSFSPLSVLWFKKHYPNVIRGFLSSGFNQEKCFIKKLFLKSSFLFRLMDINFLSYDINSLPDKKVEEFRKSHVVLGWTVRNKKDFDKGKLYCDNLICENFETFVVDK